MSEKRQYDDFPKKPGWYWFYGYPWGNRNASDTPRLAMMKIVQTSNSIVGTMSNSFIYRKDCEGFFWEAYPPNTEGLIKDQ